MVNPFERVLSRALSLPAALHLVVHLPYYRLNNYPPPMMTPSWCKAIPYGVYDLAADTGWVWGPTTTPPPSRWPPSHGGGTPSARLPTQCDQAAHHRRRRRVKRLPNPPVKTELAALAARTGLTITVCHLPPAPPNGTRSNTGSSPTSQ